MARAPWASDRLYDVAAQWVETCLRNQGSLFGSGKRLWTKAVVDEAVERIAFDDTSQRDFITKLRDELEGLSDEAITFMAELLYMHVLPIHNMGVPAKRALVDPTLSWAREPLTLPQDLVDALEGGVANYGAALTRRDKQVKCFAGFAQGWAALDDRLTVAVFLEIHGSSATTFTNSACRLSCSARRSFISRSPRRSSTRLRLGQDEDSKRFQEPTASSGGRRR